MRLAATALCAACLALGACAGDDASTDGAAMDAPLDAGVQDAASRDAPVDAPSDAGAPDLFVLDGAAPDALRAPDASFLDASTGVFDGALVGHDFGLTFPDEGSPPFPGDFGFPELGPPR